MSPPRVAFCITELDPGGAERCLTELAVRLDRRRFDPLVYVLGPPPVAHRATLLHRLQEVGTPVEFFGARRWTEFPVAAGRLHRALRRDRPNVLQCFLFHANVLGAVIGRAAGVPAIVSNVRVAEQRYAWRLRIERLTERFVDRVVAVSDAVAAQMRPHAGRAADRILVVPNGVDLSRFQDVATLAGSEAAFATDRRRVVFVGRLDPQKGVDVLLAAAAEIAGRRPDWDFVLVGEGPERASLEASAGRLEIADRVHFLGRRDDVPRILASCDLLAAPSRWEGMSNVLLEAMAAGLPVASTAVEGVAEALGPLRSEQSSPAGDEAAFAKLLDRLMEESAIRGRLGAANAARARDEFSLERMIARYESLYEALGRASG